MVAPYLISKASFVACHNFTFLLTSSFDKDTVWDRLPAKVQQQLLDKKAKFYIIDMIKLALALGLGAHINMIMQTAFFSLSPAF